MGHIISLPRRGPSVGRRAVGFAGGGTSRWLKAEGDHDETILGRLMQFSWSPTRPCVTGRCFHFQVVTCSVPNHRQWYDGRGRGRQLSGSGCSNHVGTVVPSQYGNSSLLSVSHLHLPNLWPEISGWGRCELHRFDKLPRHGQTWKGGASLALQFESIIAPGDYSFP